MRVENGCTVGPWACDWSGLGCVAWVVLVVPSRALEMLGLKTKPLLGCTANLALHPRREQDLLEDYCRNCFLGLGLVLRSLLPLGSADIDALEIPKKASQPTRKLTKALEHNF